MYLNYRLPVITTFKVQWILLHPFSVFLSPVVIVSIMLLGDLKTWSALCECCPQQIQQRCFIFEKTDLYAYKSSTDNTSSTNAALTKNIVTNFTLSANQTFCIGEASLQSASLCWGSTDDLACPAGRSGEAAEDLLMPVWTSFKREKLRLTPPPPHSGQTKVFLAVFPLLLSAAWDWPSWKSCVLSFILFR